jgi:septin family protein
MLLGAIESGKTTFIKNFLSRYVPDALTLNGSNKSKAYDDIKARFYLDTMNPNKKLKFVIYV